VIQFSLLVAGGAAQVANDRHVTICKLAQAHGMSTKTIHGTLHEDLHLSKKSARWVPKFLNQEMKNKRVRIYEAFMAQVGRNSMAMLDRIVTMEESAGVLPLTPDQAAEQTVAWEGNARADQGQSPCVQDKADGGLLQH
jgi:hypothetical protein